MDIKEQSEQQINRINPVNETNRAEDNDSLVEEISLSRGEACYYGTVGMIAIAFFVAVVLIMISMISFISGEYCVDHEEDYDDSSIAEVVTTVLLACQMFGLVGAIAGLVLLVLWNPPLETTTEYIATERIEIPPSCICAFVGFIIDGILSCLVGLGNLNTNENEHLPAWMWFLPYFLIGTCMFVLPFLLYIREVLVGPLPWSEAKHSCMFKVTITISVVHLFLSFPFGLLFAIIYRNMHCLGHCSPLFSKFCISASEDN